MKRYFGSLSFYRQALMIGVPVMLQSLIQSLVSLVDNFMVAGLGDVKMSGVSIAGQILFVFMVLSNAICAAGGIYMTQFSGAKNSAGMRQALRFKFLLIGSFIALYLLVCFVFPRQILGMMVIGNVEAEAILDAGEEYMRLMGFMGVPFCVSVVLATSMREIGQVRAPLVISVIGTLVNCVLNWVLIYGNLVPQGLRCAARLTRPSLPGLLKWGFTFSLFSEIHSRSWENMAKSCTRTGNCSARYCAEAG